jgi:HlyD family secretion protein
MPVPKKRRSWPKWVVIALALAGSVYAWKRYSERSKDAALELKTAKVTMGDIVQAVTANGQITPLKNVQVGTQVSGIIKELFVDFNSRVTNGQVIAIIDPSTYEQTITQAEAELANAKAAYLYAELNHKRAKELRAAELISPSDFDKTIVDLAQAEAVVKTRQASLKRAQVDLDKTTIVAPVDGIVISRSVDVGQTVAASFNTPTLFQIANDLRHMRIEAMVSEADVGGVDEGQDVTFQVDAFPGRPFRGKVTQVRYAPITNQNVVSYSCVVDVDNSDLKLRPGMTATASIITGEKRGVLRLPNAALRFRPPEELLPKPAGGTNTTATGGTNGMARRAEGAGGGGPGGPGGPGGGSGGGGGFDREEMRRRFESMSPEEREQMRQRFQRGVGGGGFGGGGGFRQRQQEGPVTRTVYIRDPAHPGKPMAKAVTIKTGIADGSFTEVVEGLKEGDEVLTGAVNPALAAATQNVPQGRSPFGGPGFGGGGPPRGGGR